MDSTPGFVRLLSQERGNMANTNTDAIFRGTLDRLLLSSPKETASSMRHIFGCDAVHKIQTRFAEGESGILTSENILVYPSQNGHPQRVSTFKHLSLLVSGSKSRYDTQRGPCTALVTDLVDDRVGTKENTIMDLETGDYPGRTRLNHKPISDILVSHLSTLDPSAESDLSGRQLTSSIDDQLLFGFDPISEVLKCASSHLTVLHSFLLDVLASLASHIIKWGPVGLEGNGSELSFHAAAGCVTRIHQVLQSATHATAKVNLSTKVASDLIIQPKNIKKKRSDDNNNNNNNDNKFGDICRCCGGRGHGKGPLIDPFLAAVGVTPTNLKNTILTGGKISNVPPELIFRDPRLSKTKCRNTSRRFDSLMVPMARTKTGQVGIAQERVGYDNDPRASVNNVYDALYRERKRKFIKQAIDDIKKIRLERNDCKRIENDVETKNAGEEDNSNENRQTGVESQQQQLQNDCKSPETPANLVDNITHPLLSPIQSSQQQEKTPVPHTAVDNGINPPTQLSLQHITTDPQSLNQQATPPLRLMGANLVPDNNAINSRVPSVIEDEVRASNPQNRFIRARDVARKKSMNSVALQVSSRRGPRRRSMLSL